MSKFIKNKTEIVVSEDKIEGGYKLRVDIYENRRCLRGRGKDLYPSYRNEFMYYEIKYLDNDGKLHREEDKPAYQKYNRMNILEEERWFKHGVLHRDYFDQDLRETLPAIINTNGTNVWYKNGIITRDDDEKPAYIYRGVEKRWYKNGSFVRVEDKYEEPNFFISKNGDIIYREFIKINT